MILLAVETSTPYGSLAVAEIHDGRLNLLAEESWSKKSTHSDVATLAVVSALQKAQLKMENISHFAVDVGPGSFTGLRVGINLVKTLAYGLNRPIFTLSSLELLGFQILNDGETGLLAIPAIQNLFYFSIVEKGGGKIKTLLPPQSGSLADLKTHGRAVSRMIVEGEAGSPPLVPLARELAHAASRCLADCTFLQWKDLKPLYVRASEAEEKLKKSSV